MTENEINIAIAEECGWKIERCPQPSTVKLTRPDGESCFTHINALLDYCHDLNDCHEMEKTLEGREPEKFRCTLTLICQHRQAWKDSECSLEIVHATARQRAEAFLRVKGRWKE